MVVHMTDSGSARSMDSSYAASMAVAAEVGLGLGNTTEEDSVESRRSAMSN